MRLTGASENEDLADVWAYLTRAEAELLYQALGFYFDDDDRDPGWHHHLGGEPGPRLTIAIVGEDRE